MDFKLEADDKIYLTDAVKVDISSTEIRNRIRENRNDWREDVPKEVARYIDKYGVYGI
jgi:nicotinic acid mononucleotide adenylyltransferase